jgi:hypothetical protein
LNGYGVKPGDDEWRGRALPKLFAVEFQIARMNFSAATANASFP